MRILVCGGREYNRYDHLANVLDILAARYSAHYDPDDNWLPFDITIITGGARGADQMALDWAASNYAPFEKYPAQWDIHGKSAGPIRNQQMLDTNIDLVVAFPGGVGTADMIKRARKAGVDVITV